MFTGIVKEQAEVRKITDQNGGFLLSLNRPLVWKDVELGESIAVNGVCLTVSHLPEDLLVFFVGDETLSKSTFKNLKEGDPLNLERSLQMGDRLGGHLVSGHVDGTAKVQKVEPRGECLWFELEIPSNLRKWIVQKGSLAINGVSLTVNHVDGPAADFFLIPETLQRTCLNSLKAGDLVNIECDQVVKIISEQITRYGVSSEQHP